MADGFQIDVSVETDGLTQLATELSQQQVNKAITRAINHAIGKSKTRMKRDITSDYKIPPADVNNNSLKSKRASYSNLTGYVLADPNPESLGHFRPTQVKDVLGGRRGGGYVVVARRGAGYTSTKFDRNTSRSGVYIEVVKDRKKRITSAFLIFKGSKPLVMARGIYQGAAGFKGSKDRLPITKLNTKSIYWGTLHRNTLAKWSAQTEQEYNDELIRQLNGAVLY